MEISLKLQIHFKDLSLSLSTPPTRFFSDLVSNIWRKHVTLKPS